MIGCLLTGPWYLLRQTYQLHRQSLAVTPLLNRLVDGTTNFVPHLNSALYRDLRASPHHFTAPQPALSSHDVGLDAPRPPAYLRASLRPYEAVSDDEAAPQTNVRRRSHDGKLPLVNAD